MKTIRHPVNVHWGDTDPAKIVFYPNYFSWFDQSTRMLFESVGIDWDTLMARYGVPGLPIVEANGRFIAPCRFRDQLEVESRIGTWNDKTFVVQHTVWNGTLKCVEGHEVRVWSKPREDDPARLKAHSIPPEIRAAFD
jgi:4-hydroxybenzoyl-CoA thioesterase